MISKMDKVIRLNFMKLFSFVLLTMVFFPPFVASAETVLRTGESVSVEDNQVVENDFYAAASTITMSGEVLGDMYAVGGSVTANGSVGADMTLVAGAAQVHASTTDDLRVVAGETVVAEYVGGDLFVIGGLLKVLSSATIEGDVFFYGGEAEINGQVKGSVIGAAEKMRIDTAVGKDVDVTLTDTLTLGDRASIGGDVRYFSPNEITRAQNAVIEGEVVKNTQELTRGNKKAEDVLIPIFVSLFAVLSIYLVFRNELQRLISSIMDSAVKSGLVGLGVLVVGPLVSILLIATVLGMLVGFVGIFLLLSMYVLSMILTGALLGGILSKYITKKEEVGLLWILAGSLGVHLLLSIPVIGPFVVFVLFLLTLGGLSVVIYRLIGR